MLALFAFIIPLCVVTAIGEFLMALPQRIREEKEFRRWRRAHRYIF